MTLSIIVFCYNEESTIKKVVLDALEFLIREDINDNEVIIVNDGSTDKSKILLEELSNEYSQLKIINHQVNLGIGMALKTGYKEASKQFIVAIPGDGQFDTTDLKKIKKWDVNKFYCFYRKDKNYNSYRNFLSGFNLFLNSIFINNRLKDVNWVKVYTKSQLTNARPQLNSSLIESEISSKLIKKGYQYEELPSNYLPRIGGKSKGGNFKTVSKALFEMIKLIYIIKKY